MSSITQKTYSADSSTKFFGNYVFTFNEMKQVLAPEVYENIINALDEKNELNNQYAEAIASSIKNWALAKGATHFTHWFQPSIGLSGERQESFLDQDTKNNNDIIDNLSGKRLLQSEISGSAFPSGGLRSTSESRGYTVWDPSTPPFLWKNGSSLTLCIPSIYVSWKGDVLDHRLPLLRSEKAIRDAVLRMFNLTKTKIESLHVTVGCEQEFFLINKEAYDNRPDLVLLGQTVYGSTYYQKKDLVSDFFTPVNDAIATYMDDVEESALKLGIPIKTHHHEQAPNQYEVTTLFERASLAVDHNILLMELLKKTALKHNLVCLLSEKPFKGFYGSGKHCNWSLMTGNGINLLNPRENSANPLHFILLITAILHAVYTHATLLRSCAGSYLNDYRLGGDAAPSSIISVDMGTTLEQMLHVFEKTGSYELLSRSTQNLGLTFLPKLNRASCDRNRTSLFAFTDDRFEYRAVGASANPAFPITTINAIVAESLNEILEAIEINLKQNNSSFNTVALPVIQHYLKKSKKIRYTGDTYTKKWFITAQKRGLKSFKNSILAFPAFTAKKTFQTFNNILSKQELESRALVLLEHYIKLAKLEINLMLELFKTNILPAVMRYQKALAQSLKTASIILSIKEIPQQKEFLHNFSLSINRALTFANNLEDNSKLVFAFEKQQQAETLTSHIKPLMQALRTEIDLLETLCDEREWPLENYRKILFH